MKLKTITLALFSILMLAAMLVQPGYAQDSTYLISVTPSSDAKSGQPGAVVIYTLTVTNTGNMSVDLNVDVSSLNNWVYSSDPASFTLDPGKGTSVVVTVAIRWFPCLDPR